MALEIGPLVTAFSPLISPCETQTTQLTSTMWTFQFLVLCVYCLDISHSFFSLPRLPTLKPHLAMSVLEWRPEGYSSWEWKGDNINYIEFGDSSKVKWHNLLNLCSSDYSPNMLRSVNLFFSILYSYLQKRVPLNYFDIVSTRLPSSWTALHACRFNSHYMFVDSLAPLTAHPRIWSQCIPLEI